MSSHLTTDQVWKEVKKEIFCVLGMVTANQESRTVGVVYLVQDRQLLIGTGKDTWKARHIRDNPSVSITIPIAKRIPLLPWIKIPAATITFSGTARVLSGEESSPELLSAVFRHKADDEEFLSNSCLIEIHPQGDFLTYGIGVPLMHMRQPELARGRVSV